MYNQIKTLKINNNVEHTKTTTTKINSHVDVPSSNQ